MELGTAYTLCQKAKNFELAQGIRRNALSLGWNSHKRTGLLYVLCWERWASSSCSLAKGININAPSCPTCAWSLTNGEMAVTPKPQWQHSGAPVAFSQTMVQRGLALWKPGVQLTRQRELGCSLDCPLLSPSFLPDHCWLGSTASLVVFHTAGDSSVISQLLPVWIALHLTSRKPPGLTERTLKRPKALSLLGNGKELMALWDLKRSDMIRRPKLMLEVLLLLLLRKSSWPSDVYHNSHQKVRPTDLWDVWRQTKGTPQYFWITEPSQSTDLSHCVVISLLWVVLKMLWSCRVASKSMAGEKVGLSRVSRQHSKVTLLW